MAVYRLLSVYIAIACCNACLKVEFLVDKVMVDKTSNSDLQAMLSGISTNNECGIKCMETTGCMSFFYNQADGNCRLHSAMFKSSESSLAATPGFTYRKPFCPPLAKDLIPNGKTGVFSEGGFLVARTSCESDAIFVGTADSVKCDADGFLARDGVMRFNPLVESGMSLYVYFSRLIIICYTVKIMWRSPRNAAMETSK
ncbi:uncharacterized protein LOC124287525 [Haliotis rubra]|uniref:uncharacterized protein LOC124287525 n=1 Tax=Haliotis rubra TaxID=36100 RepID=UPI001EE57BF8|nr:uncharacterized protein LOC124287525 [Haliotis rubra]